MRTRDHRFIKNKKEKKINKLFQSKKGFTLVELVVNMAIIGIIMVIVTSLTGISIDSFNRHNKKNDAVIVANLVMSTIENRVNKVGHAKLEKYFEPVKILDSENNFIKYKDLNGDNKPDTLIRDASGNEYPVCLYDLKNYSMIFQMPDKVKNYVPPTNLDENAKTLFNNSEKKKLEGADRRGKLYFLQVVSDAQEATINTSGKPGYNIDGYVNRKKDNEQIIAEEMLDDKLYRGYSVDCRFKYIAEHVETTATIPEGETNLPNFGKYSCVQIIVDVYDGANKIHSATRTVTFLQRFFEMDKTYGTYDEEKDIILFRG